MAPLGKSDHAVLLIETNVYGLDEINVKKFNYDKGDYDSFRSYLQCDWDEELVPAGSQIEELWQILKNKIETGNRNFIPEVKKFYTSRNGKWKHPINQNLRKHIRLKSSLWKKYIECKNEDSYKDYKKQRNKVRSLIRKDQRDLQNKIANDYKNNPKKFWNYVNGKTKTKEKIGDLNYISNEGYQKMASTDIEKAELLCKFFSSVFCNEPEADFEALADRNCSKESSPVTIIESGVLLRLSRINKNKSAGPDSIHPRILYEMRQELAYPLTKIFNISMETKRLPYDWKSANISAIFKKGKKSEVNNYRPVSLTSVVCKLMESIIRDNLMAHFLDNGLFSKRQFGFLKRRSTVTQLLQILDDWTDRLELGGRIDVVYTDLEKAFDKVPHRRLISPV
jgi:hypothetical protein